MNKSAKLIHHLTRDAIFAALSFCFTFFLKIPYANGGYFNFGDVIIIVAGLCFGPVDAAIIGLLGGCLSDLVGGFFIYLPATAISKLLLGLGTGLLRINYSKMPKWLSVLFGILYPLIAILPYFVVYYFVYGFSGSYLIFFDMIQEYVCLFLAHCAFYFLRKTPINLISLH